MCEFFSGVSTFINGTRHDYVSSEGLMSHTAIMEEHHLKDSLATWGRIVPWELVPPLWKYSTPLSKWKLRADMEFLMQSGTPFWWEEDQDKIRSFAIREASKRILTSGSHTITKGTWIVKGDAKVIVDTENGDRGGEGWDSTVYILLLADKACMKLIDGCVLDVTGEAFLDMKGGRCSKAGGKSLVHLQGGMLSLARQSATVLLDNGQLDNVVQDVRLIRRGGMADRISDSVLYQDLS